MVNNKRQQSNNLVIKHKSRMMKQRWGTAAFYISSLSDILLQ
uniref:Uncharacterized protein n=1 Tax=Rhizophora mucronata TaxID=61149 RepID=A0A2P2Q9E2_RHIMU